MFTGKHAKNTKPLPVPVQKKGLADLKHLTQIATRLDTIEGIHKEVKALVDRWDSLPKGNKPDQNDAHAKAALTEKLRVMEVDVIAKFILTQCNDERRRIREELDKAGFDITQV